jgi:crotonobetainyl-CoA hydratase
VVERGVAGSVAVERRGHVMVVTIDRPEAGNAVDLGVSTAIGAALEEADADPAVRAVVLTGRGDRFFCAGADLKALGRGEAIAPADERRAAWGFGGYVRHRISKPTVAAVNGMALGGGAELVLASDLAVASQTAVLGLPEVRRGLFAGGGGAFRLGRQIPPKIALELLLTGDVLSAARAGELGLVNRVVPQAAVLTEALELAGRIAANAPLAVQATKRLALGIEAGDAPGEAAHWARSDAETAAIFGTADLREGLRAFTERRAPDWQAR